MSTAKYTPEIAVSYLVAGLNSEAGELAASYAKALLRRDIEPNTSGLDIKLVLTNHMMEEIGDVLWYCACLAHELGYTLADIAVANERKLRRRKEKGNIIDDGTNR